MLHHLGLLALAASAVGDPPRYTLTTIDFDNKAADVVGNRKSGMLCTPAGRVRFSDLGVSREKLVKALSVELAGAGVDIKIPSDDDFDREVRSLYRITVNVPRLTLNACVPWRGLRVGRQAKTRLSGRVITLWRVFDQRSRTLMAKILICRSFKDSSDVDDLQQATERLIAGFAKDVVPSLEGIPTPEFATPLVPRTVGCDEGEKGALSV